MLLAEIKEMCVSDGMQHESLIVGHEKWFQLCGGKFLCWQHFVPV